MKEIINQIGKREIKFRAWDEDEAKMFYDLERSPSFDWWLDQFGVMQYTGLKDKNGKEIYEGDIVRINNFGETIINQANGVVVWDKDGLDYNVVDSNNDFLIAFGLNKSQYEIIGNIFENPELLTQ